MFGRILGGHYQKPTLKQINKTKKQFDVKVRMLKINKSELKTNETLITQFTNALFYIVDKNRLQLVTYMSVPMQELIHKQKMKQKQHLNINKNFISLKIINKT